MSRYFTHIRPPEYLRNWLVNEFWDEEAKCVSFPRGSAPRAVLKALLRARPKNAPVEDTSDMLRVEVPSFKGINPATFNYLSAPGQSALISACKDLFQATLVLELSPLFPYDVAITDVVYDFMDRHGIERTERNWEAIRQMYYRLRKKTFRLAKS